MIIKSTRDVNALLTRRPEVVKDLAETHEVTVEPGVTETWDARAEPSLVELQREGSETRLNLVLRFTEGDPKSGEMVADMLKGVETAVRNRAAAERPKEPPPKIEIHKVAGYASIGAAGGYFTSLLLQELARVGQASGNPYVSTVAVAMTGLGGVAGALWGTGDLRKFTLTAPGVSGEFSRAGG